MRFSRIIILLAILGITKTIHAQNMVATPIDKLPLNILNATNDTSKAMILYITGDGGWNKFSKNFATAMAANGYPVVSLNANDYFWKKKTAAQTAVDVALLIRTYQKNWNRKKIVLIGYSFGADVVPFVFNRLPADISAGISNICLLSVSTTTDFEIHLSVMFGGKLKDGESVIAEINKITTKPIALIFGEDETGFPLNLLKNKNYSHITLVGGHHYDDDETSLSKTIIQQIPKK
jgi:type IV secretory pathway VirJ component